MIEAGLAHIDLLRALAPRLLLHLELGYVLLRRKRLREMVKILEPVFMSIIQCELRPFHLLIEIDESTRTLLGHSLMESVHSRLVRVEPLRRIRIISLVCSNSRRLVERTKPFPDISVLHTEFLFLLSRKILFVLKDFVQHTRALLRGFHFLKRFLLKKKGKQLDKYPAPLLEVYF